MHPDVLITIAYGAQVLLVALGAGALVVRDMRSSEAEEQDRRSPQPHVRQISSR